MFLVWLPCQRKKLIKIFFRLFTVWMLKVGASRLSLVEIYVHGCYHVWIRAGVGKVKERTTLSLQTSFTKWCRADVWWLFLVVFLINEELLRKIRKTKRHGLETTTWEMVAWNGGKRVRRHTATIATTFFSFFEISDLLFNKFNMAPLRPSYNRGLLNCLQRICSSSWLIIYANVPDYKIRQQITSTIRRWNGNI